MDYHRTARDSADCREIRSACGDNRTIAFISGNFNVIHPGHLRLLKFAAELADVLVVGVNSDKTAGVTIPLQMRLENVSSIGMVDYVIALDAPPEELIATLKPDVVVKGKEFEQRTNPEKAAVDAYGGRLIFSAGELRFASLSLLERESEADISAIRKPLDFPSRQGFDISGLKATLAKMSGMRVVVIGDLIVDEYVTCDPIGMSQEDPTIVVTPITSKIFVGGAGGVAGHAKGLGAEVRYCAIVGEDESAKYASDSLEEQGVRCDFFVDESRPTSRKQRFRALNKTLLRVNHLRHQPASSDIQGKILAAVEAVLPKTDLLLFSCFNYGCLPQNLVEVISAKARACGVMMGADSQSSSQIGDISRFKAMALITPTEREARLALNDFESGLAAVGVELLEKAHAENLLITLGAEGVLVNTMRDGTLKTDLLPAFNQSPKDVSGAGDSLFVSSAMALRVGANIWQSSYLGALAAALQVSRLGNISLTVPELVREIDETGFSYD